MDTAVLLQCHRLDEAILAEYAKLAEATKSFANCKLLIQTDDEIRLDQPYEHVTSGDLERLPWRKSKPLRPGEFFFAVLALRWKFVYRYYWVIEYDVRYSGNWTDFFAAFAENPADFLTSHIRTYAQEPNWYWWALHHPNQIVKAWSRVRSFNPIYRISGAAVDFLHACLADGWSGHSEVLMPTLLHHGGHHIEDFGGNGPFVVAENVNRFYIDADARQDGTLRTGTMRWKPVAFEVGPESGKLHHPVKVLRP